MHLSNWMRDITPHKEEATIIRYMQSQGRGTLQWELRKNLLVEPPQLIYLVLYGPQKDLSDPCRLELEEFFGALGSGAKR